jgi:predicted transcriptional regulator
MILTHEAWLRLQHMASRGTDAKFAVQQADDYAKRLQDELLASGFIGEYINKTGRHIRVTTLGLAALNEWSRQRREVANAVG